MKLAKTRARALVSRRALERVVDLEHALRQQEQAADEQDEVAPGDSPDHRQWNQRLDEPREPDDREQQRDARQHRERQAGDARRLAAAPAAGGSTRIEMKMMLSMPRTISSSDSVTNAIHAWGSDEQLEHQATPALTASWSTAVF